MAWFTARRALRATSTCSRCGTPLNPVGECSYCEWLTRGLVRLIHRQGG